MSLQQQEQPSAAAGEHIEPDTSVPIFVLRRSLGRFQHCALAVARTAGRLGIPVYTVRMGKREPATRSRYVRGSLSLSPDAAAEDWVKALLALGDGLPGAVLLPIDDLAAVVVGDHQDRLAAKFLLPHQPAGLQRRLASKRELWSLCNQLGLATPRSTFPRDEEELTVQAREHGYPVVVKRSEPWVTPSDPTAPSVFIAHSREQLLHAYARMESPLHAQVMLQEYIPGHSDTIWMFNGYFGRSGDCLCAFTGRKLRQRGPHTGPTSLGICETNGEVSEAAISLMRSLDYQGIVDMGFRYDARDGQYKLLDVNPRLGSTFRLFASGNGVDVVRAMHLDLTGRPVPASRTSDGRKWIDEPGDLTTAAQLARGHTLGLRSWMSSLRGIDEGAWWAADDPLPFLTMGVRFVPHALRAGAKRKRL